MISRSFEGFAPPPRFDADPFVEVEILEADKVDGTYVLIETLALEPVDPDPANPLIRDFSTDSATQEPGWYQIVWKDASGDTASSGIIYVPLVPSWSPTVAEVAALLRARTKVSSGAEVGTFNEETRPTGAEVERLIAQATRRVATSIGIDPCTADLRLDAGAATALYTAMLIEQSYYPEQTQAAGSSFKSLEALWKDQISTLAESVSEQCGTPVSGDDGSGEFLARAAWYGDDRTIIGPCSGPY